MRNEEHEILIANQLSKRYVSNQHALKNVSFSIRKGECLGLVGESGSGKSTLVRCLLQVDRVDSGEVLFNSDPLHHLRGKSLQNARQKMQAVFQHPAAALNPRLKIIDSLMEPYDVIHGIGRSSQKSRRRRQRALELLEMVKLPIKVLDTYPHELSGGMNQRVNIARAINTNPSLLLLDEPTASLDVSVQASLLNLLKDLQEYHGLSYLFISHDLSAVSFMSDAIMVMKKGEILDSFQKRDLFASDRNEYTVELLDVFEM